MKALIIAGNNLRRMLRQPMNIFFVFIFPMLLILLLGATFGGGVTPKLGVFAQGSGPLADELVAALSAKENLKVEQAKDPESLTTNVERGTYQGGVILDSSYTDDLKSGREAKVQFFLRPDQQGQQLRTAVDSAVASQAEVLRAARFVSGETGASFDQARDQALKTLPQVAPINVDLGMAGQAPAPKEGGRFSQGAGSQLLLFIFLTSMTGSVALIETRRLGLSRRMFSTPTAGTTIVLGEMLGRFGVALLQGAFIMVGSLLFFGVSWGSPAAAVALLVLFSLVGAGAGMLLGSIFRTEQQAVSVGLLLGLGLAALGGSMVPLEFFSSNMKKIAHITPHAWALDGFASLVQQHEGFTAILPQLGVLAAYAAVLLTLATWRLRRSITA